jgi:adenylate cyclase class 2
MIANLGVVCDIRSNLAANGRPFRYPVCSLPVETEVKIAVVNLENVRRRLRYLRYRVHARRVFESNLVLDTPQHQLRSTGELLRLRRVGREAVLTFKGVSKPGRHKSREEIETGLSNADALEQILMRLGYVPAFRYEKYRTEYMRESEPGIITVDETPIGNYVELEGAPEWIDGTAVEIGFSPSDYITKSYATLYVEFCRKRGATPTNMVFSRRSAEKQSRT